MAYFLIKIKKYNKQRLCFSYAHLYFSGLQVADIALVTIILQWRLLNNLDLDTNN